MPQETVSAGGQTFVTLAEHIRPGMRAIFVGINPAPRSVAAGHYYQGNLGRRFWDRVREHGIVPWTKFGAEDDDAVRLGFGFADLVRRPTASADDLSRQELQASAEDLVRRLRALPDRPPVVFVFAAAAKHAAGGLVEAEGFRTFRMPRPYEGVEKARTALDVLAQALEAAGS